MPVVLLLLALVASACLRPPAQLAGTYPPTTVREAQGGGHVGERVRWGGTVVSTALEEMARIVQERYPASQWNIYAAQASDGDNLPMDNSNTVALLREVILPMCQYYAYLEVGHSSDEPGHSSDPTSLWRAYEMVIGGDVPMAMRKVGHRRDIYPVFRELFDKASPGGA